MAVDLFAGVRVRDYASAREWYGRLLGKEPSFGPHTAEPVWELAAHRHLHVLEDRQKPGGGLVTVLVGDLAAVAAAIASRGIEPVVREACSNGVRKLTYRDADGNEIVFGGGQRGTLGP